MARLMGRPAPVEVSHKNLRFLITHMPNDRSIAKFVEVIGYFYLNINYFNKNLGI